MIRVFVASPSDVQAEREALVKLASEINLTIAAVAPEKGVRLEVVRWETHAFPAGGAPQKVINEQVGEHDVFVGIMWRRFGTPTDDAASGTEEEFDRAYNQFITTGKPHIMFYFCQAPAPPPRSAQEVEQLARLVAFRDKLSQLALVWEYSDHSKFADTVRPHLLKAVMAVSPVSEVLRSIPPAGSERLSNLRSQLHALAAEYARIRKDMERSDARTRQLELVATGIRTLALEAMPLLNEFISGHTPAERLVASVFLQVEPDVSHLHWLGERLAETQPFIGYHAAVALLAAVRSLDCSYRPSIAAAIALGRKRLGNRPGTDRQRVLQAAQRELEARCGVE